ncbi:threonine/serine exporter [Clostridium tetani]|uniref:Threonine/serine exporter n=2 Tax=Clostridium tetani TaxID=1513 RepID=A0ABY0ENZ7_CLOTA|nr:threonine/serine exporter [Clostridium tetani]RXI68515.1 threonine/serine exporter [Clostridium tetani]
MYFMDITRILHLSTFAGEIMLQSGAEIYRVEETVYRICVSYGLKEVDVFATPTGIIISATDENNNTISKVKRIKSRTVDLDKVSRVNNLSRDICTKNLSLALVQASLENINKSEKYSKKTTFIASSTVAGFFTLVYGGNSRDFIVSLFIGPVIQFFSILLSKIQTNSFFINALGGAIASFIALLGTSIGVGHSTDHIVIGSVMLLVPGLIITNAIRDTIEGDLITGLTRASEAFLIAIAIALGSGVVFSLWLYLGGTYQ